MVLARPEKPADPQEGIRNHLDAFIMGVQEEFESMIANFKRWWKYSNPENWTREDMQTRYDMWAEMPALDNENKVIPGLNALQYSFQKTYSRYLYLLDYDKNAFSDGRYDPLEQKTPEGFIYHEYETPGWRYKWRDDMSGIIFLDETPIDFRPLDQRPEVEQS